MGARRVYPRGIPYSRVRAMTDSLPSKKRLYPSDMGSGQYLAAARSWLQSNLPNGDRGTWGSGDLLTMSERQFEDAAAHIAAAAINEDRQKRAHETERRHDPEALRAALSEIM